MTRHTLVAVMLCAFSAVVLAGPEAPGVDLPPRSGLIGALFAAHRDDSNAQILTVAKVLPISPAFRKLHQGDVIASIDGIPVRDPIAAQRALRAAGPGRLLLLQVVGSGTARIVQITVAPLTQEWERKLAAAEEAMQHNVSAEGLLAYLPQALCNSGGAGEFFGLWAFGGLLTAAAVDSAQPDCRETFQPCAPLTLLRQDDSETLMRAGGRKYRLAGDWRQLTFDSAEECKAAAGSSASMPAQGRGRSSSWSAASQ